MFYQKCIYFMVACVIWGTIEAGSKKKNVDKKLKDTSNIDDLLKAVPQEYERFSVKNKSGAVIAEYVIQDVPLINFLDVADLFNDYYLSDEPLNKLRGSIRKKDSFTNNWLILLTQGKGLGCFDTNTGDLIGALLTYPMEKPSKRVTSDEMTSFIFDFDICHHFKVERYLSLSALVVHPDHRKRGIAEHLLSNTRKICEQLNLPIASGVFTSDGSNRAAKNVGFDVIVGASYEELAEKHESLRHLKGLKDKEINRRSIRYLN